MSVEVSVGEHLYNHRRFFYHRQQCGNRLQLVLAHNDHQLKMYITPNSIARVQHPNPRLALALSTRQSLRVDAFLMWGNKESPY